MFGVISFTGLKGPRGLRRVKRLSEGRLGVVGGQRGSERMKNSLGPAVKYPGAQGKEATRLFDER